MRSTRRFVGLHAAVLVPALLVALGTAQGQARGIEIDTVLPAAAQPGADGRIDPLAATNAYLAMVPAEQRAQSDAYYEGGYWIGLWETLLTVGLMVLVLHAGFSRRLRDWAEKATPGRARQVALYAVVFLLLLTIASTPWAAYVGFFRERQYDLMNQTFGQWFVDYLKANGIGLLFGTAAVTGFYAIVRRVPRTWPLWGAAAGTAFLAFGALIGPVYIQPLFNTYRPVTDERVREPVLQMARANGLAVDQVYVFDQSRQTKRISANVAGLFGTRRIALNDNLLERTSLPEIKAVMGHEIGHFVLNHVYEYLLAFVLLLLFQFLLLRWSFDRSVARWGRRWGVAGIGDVAGLPLLIALFTVIAYVSGPASRAITRSNEAEADAFGLNAAREPDGFARAALRLGEYRKLEPSPIEEWLFFTHPSGRARIYRAMVFKAAQVP